MGDRLTSGLPVLIVTAANLWGYKSKFSVSTTQKTLIPQLGFPKVSLWCKVINLEAWVLLGSKCYKWTLDSSCLFLEGFRLKKCYLFSFFFAQCSDRTVLGKNNLLPNVKDDNPMLVKAVRTYYGFGGFPFGNDLALLELQKPIEPGTAWGPSSSAVRGLMIKIRLWHGVQCLVCVWGRGVGGHLCILDTKGC